MAFAGQNLAAPHAGEHFDAHVKEPFPSTRRARLLNFTMLNKITMLNKSTKSTVLDKFGFPCTRRPLLQHYLRAQNVLYLRVRDVFYLRARDVFSHSRSDEEEVEDHVH